MIVKNGNTFTTVCLLLFLTASPGCMPLEQFRNHPELPERAGAISRVGLAPPMIILYEEQFRFGVNKIIPVNQWSRTAADCLKKAFIDESTAMHLPIKIMDVEDPEAAELLDVFKVVDFSIQRHAYKTHLKETFPEKLDRFEYALGPVRDLMDRNHIEGIWIITGFNLIPTAGAQAGDAAQHLLAIVSALGGGPGVAFTQKKLEFRAALVDKSGDIVFYTKLDESNVGSARSVQDRVNPLQVLDNTTAAPEEAFIASDFRNPETARHYIRALLSKYRKAVTQ